MGIKTALNIPWEAESVSGRYFSDRKLASTATAYNRVPLIYRAVRLRCNGLTRVPRYIYEGKYSGGKEVEQYRFEDSLSLDNLLWLSEAATLLAGGSFVLKNANQFGYQAGLQWLNPFTVETDTRTGELHVWQQTEQGRYPKDKPYWTVEDFLFFKDFNPGDDLGMGIPAARVALEDGQILLSVSSFLSNFFTADALPVTMVIMPSGVNVTERERVEKWFRDKLTRMRNAAARVLGVGGEVKIEKLTSDLATFDIDKVDTHAIQNIAWAFDIPKTVLTADSANRSTADTEYRTFVDHTIVPRCRYYESVLNPFLAEWNQRIEFAPEELPELQVDESDRADSLGKLVATGMPLRAALDILGYDLSEEAEAELAKAEREKEENKKKLEENPPPAQPPVQGNGQDEAKADLDKWLRKSLKKLRLGESPVVQFESTAIPEHLRASIGEGLKSVKTEDELRQIFR